MRMNKKQTKIYSFFGVDNKTEEWQKIWREMETRVLGGV